MPTRGALGVLLCSREGLTHTAPTPYILYLTFPEAHTIFTDMKYGIYTVHGKAGVFEANGPQEALELALEDETVYALPLCPECGDPVGEDNHRGSGMHRRCWLDGKGDYDYDRWKDREDR